MKTVVWERVKGTVSALPVPFIGRDRPGGRPSLEEDEVEQALRQVVGDTPDVEQPLLQSTNAESASEPQDTDQVPEADGMPPSEKTSKGDGASMAASVFSLTNTIIGAGIMALPRAVATLGVVPGALLILLVYILTFITINVLSSASEYSGRWTFGELIHYFFGRTGSWFLRLFIFINNAGLLITYTIMLGDVLVGKPPDYNGLLTNLTDIHEGDVWYLDRRFVVAVVVVVFLFPLAAQRSLKSLAWAGAMGLVLASGFAMLVVVLVVLAGIQGRIQGVSLWPNADLTGPSALDQIRGVFSTLPVIALAYVCHYNVHPLMRELKDFSARRWSIVLNWSLTFCTVVYVIIGVGLYLVFLDSTESDVLLNFSSGSLEDIVGSLAADIITYCVLLGYALNLIFTYPMINWGLREVIAEVAVGRPTLGNAAWVGITAVIVVAAYAVAIAVPNIWPVMTITGATAAVAIGWIFPACIMLRTSGGRCSSVKRLGACLLILLGLLTAVVAVHSTIEDLIHQ
ncbi:hypothetical protein CVIRNUC_005099 [Coccomyxa viridis]|uniref:Amino acid transporter transmembrane domain-containing protein n=1 Tax=Coccomyxa viridis TaxID=1274662 RepID=A0AAV1I3I7_9CHLO|nr:hypothetical protein CVIRNUC_005099 [Coccomyxa viridis]